jgi:hypothetical protein
MRPPIPDVPTYWGMMPVSVGTRDVEGLALTLRSGARIAGAVEFDGASEKPTVDRLRQVQISIEPSDGRSIGSLSSLVQLRQGQLDAQGRISTYQLPAGKYVIRPQTLPGWTFEGAYLEGRDVSHFPLELGADDMAGVVLKFTDRPPELSGTVRSENGAGDPTALVLIFPRDERGWTDYGASPRRLRSVSPDTNGAYRVTGLPTGEYLVAAVNEEALQPWQDPAVLQKLAGLATSVTIGPGEKKSQDLVVRGLR